MTKRAKALIIAGITLIAFTYFALERLDVKIERQEVVSAEGNRTYFDENGAEVFVKAPPPKATAFKHGGKKDVYRDTVTGRITELRDKRPEGYYLKIVTLEDGDERVVLANIPQVHTLRTVYMNRNVRLKGEWRKSVVVAGKGYRSFWVDDVDLAEEK